MNRPFRVLSALILLVVMMTAVTGTGHGQAPSPATPVPRAATPAPPPPCAPQKLTLESLCREAWIKTAASKLKKNDPGAFTQYETASAKLTGEAQKELIWQYARKPHYVCNEFVVAAYGEIALPLNYLRASVDGQKDTIEARWGAATVRTNWTQIAVVVLTAFVTLLAAITAAFSDAVGEGWKIALKVLSIVLPVILSVITSIAAYYDFRGIYVAESRASVEISDLQSQIEDAIITGCVKVKGPDNKDQLEAIGLTAIIDWQARRSTILRADAETYIKRHESSSTK